MGKPVGIEALSMVAGVTKADYSYLIEPYILMRGYISRTSRGRVLTSKGTLFLQEIVIENRKM